MGVAAVGLIVVGWVIVTLGVVLATGQLWWWAVSAGTLLLLAGVTCGWTAILEARERGE